MRSEINGLYSLFHENLPAASRQWWVCTWSLEADTVGQLLHLESHDQPTNCSPPLPTDPQSRTFRTFARPWEALIKNPLLCPHALSLSTVNGFS
jgi:hypothetical protein